MYQNVVVHHDIGETKVSAVDHEGTVEMFGRVRVVLSEFFIEHRTEHHQNAFV
jgi:hypothetical protein